MINRTWVVCSAYEEEKRLSKVLSGLLMVVDHIVVVDDGSRDETVEVAKRYPIWLIRHPFNLGQGAALQTGIDFALAQNAEFIITFDTDGQHDPFDISVLLSGLRQENADFALGSRFLGQTYDIPLMRKLILKAAIFFTRLLSGVKLTDAHNGIRAMTSKGARAIRITMNRMEHASELIDQIAESGLKYIEVPVSISYFPDTLEKGQNSTDAFRLAVKLIMNKFIK